MQPVLKLGEKITWFPGHMYRATRLLKESISDVDLFVEVRDARVPISSRNYELDEIIREFNKPKVILMNKYDVCNQRITGKLIEDMKKAKIDVFPMSAQLGTNIHTTIEFAKKLKPAKYQTVGIWMMIGGMPNVGKSSILNKFRNISKSFETKKNIAKVGPLPCVTRGVNGFRISQEPLMYLVDTPGIMVPRIVDDEVGLKLAMVGCIKDSIVGKDIIIDYMLTFLNKQTNKKYLAQYGLPCEVSNASDLCNHVRARYKQNNLNTTYDMILEHFRNGDLGHVTLDEVDMKI